MELSYIKAFLSNNFLRFLTKYLKPKVGRKKLAMFPVQHNGTMLHFADHNNVANCENQIIAIANWRTALTSTFREDSPIVKTFV